MGELVAEELAVQAFEGPEPPNIYDNAQRGVWYEFMGDFRTVGRLEDPETPYRKAKRTYRDAGDPDTSYSEQSNRAAIYFLYSTADAAGANMDAIYETTTRQPFSEWITYKQTNLPRWLAQLDEQQSYPNAAGRVDEPR